MLSGRTVVCLATLDWDACWQAPQQVCALLAEAGCRVLYLENTGVRAPGLQDGRRLARRAANWLGGRGRFREVRPNLHLYSPPALPFPYWNAAQAWNRWGPCRTVAAWLRRRGGPPPVLLSFLPTRFALDLAAAVRPAVSAYWCAARFAESSPGARPVEGDEAEVIRRFDLVLAISHDLEDHCRRFRQDVLRLPLGVHLETFERAVGTAEPAEVSALRRPRIGYVGALHGALDQPLMGDLSRRMPEASFVMVGPRQVPTHLLEGLPNLHLVGPRDHPRIPEYVAAFDVCLIPYLVNAYTEGVYPSKLNEYLALGKPVVSTPLAEIRHFNEEFGGVVAVAEGAEGFRRCIGDSLAEAGDGAAQRREVARRNSWADRVARLAALLEARL